MNFIQHYKEFVHIRSRISKLQFEDGLLDVSIGLFILLNWLSYLNSIFILVTACYLFFILPRLWNLIHVLVTWPRIGYGSIQNRCLFYCLPVSILCITLANAILFIVHHQGNLETWAASRLGMGFHGYLLSICTFILGACWALPRFLIYAFLLGLGNWFFTVASPRASPSWALATAGLAMLAVGWSKWLLFSKTCPAPSIETSQPPRSGFPVNGSAEGADRRLLLRFLSHLEAADIPFLAQVTGLSRETVDYHLGLLAETGCICTLDRHKAWALSPTATLTEKGFQQLRSFERP